MASGGPFAGGVIAAFGMLYFGMDPIWLVLGAVVGTVWCAVLFLRGGLLAGCVPCC